MLDKRYQIGYDLRMVIEAQVYTVSEVAVMLNLSAGTVQRMIDDGRLVTMDNPGGKAVRILRSSVERLLRRNGEPEAEVAE